MEGQGRNDARADRPGDLKAPPPPARRVGPGRPHPERDATPEEDSGPPPRQFPAVVLAGPAFLCLLVLASASALGDALGSPGPAMAVATVALLAALGCFGYLASKARHDAERIVFMALMALSLVVYASAMKFLAF